MAGTNQSSTISTPTMKVFQGNDNPGIDVFTLTPMSTGDIIDRAARLYRRRALDLLRIALLPSLTSYTGLILLSIGIDNFSLVRGDSRVVLSLMLIGGGAGLFLLGKAAFYALLGGASRSFFDHILRSGGVESGSEARPFAAREVYHSVRERFWPLIGAMVMLLVLAFLGALLLYLGVSVLLVGYLTLHLQVLSRSPIALQVLLATLFGIVLVGGVIWATLQFYGRIVYVPQVLLVEGGGVTRSLTRSFRLAAGGVRRIGTLLLFWVYVAWSLWILLILPLGWYGYMVGIDSNPFNLIELEGPLWYRIARQTLTQLSEILVAPIAMLGFTLLYVDTRIRKEGLDIEVLANRILAPPPESPQPPQRVETLDGGAPSQP